MQQLDSAKLEAVVTQALSDLSGAQGGVMMNLGHKLGLFRALKGAGPVSAAELAKRSGCAERYVREWANSQVAGGYLAYHPSSETYEMTPEQAMVLADDDSPVFFPNAWSVNASMWFDEEKILAAFRTGQGISWGDHHERLFCGVAAFYRNGYQASLVPEWLPALEGVVPKLEKGAKVADVGCGHGHSTVIMAKAFPNSRFWGFDAHPASIAAARRIAQDAGVADRVTFEIARATEYPALDYDLIAFFDCLHDMGHPDRALKHAAKSLAPEGTVMLVEPFAHDKVEQNVGPIGRLYYAGSSTICVPHAISEHGSHSLGAQAGPERLGSIVKAAGFTHFRRALATPFNLILEARR
ncbi:Demethylrebeccamycin-D-glucose O-methyltransferase [Burkholderiales bacterium]|nr:Demethylrebeccamycin-D-glucose O-methyltransferase [Burkholderiales bacterium]